MFWHLQKNLWVFHFNRTIFSFFFQRSKTQRSFVQLKNEQLSTEEDQPPVTRALTTIVPSHRAGYLVVFRSLFVIFLSLLLLFFQIHPLVKVRKFKTFVFSLAYFFFFQISDLRFGWKPILVLIDLVHKETLKAYTAMKASPTYVGKDVSVYLVLSSNMKSIQAMS